MSAKKILIANRGEIAIRIARTVREMGHVPVMVFSDADQNAMHVRFGDEAYRLPGNLPAETYLQGQKIIDIAKTAGVHAIHPGYGFLSENAAFATACEKAGIIFIGPSAESIQGMGDKVSARILAQKAKVPTLSGSNEAASAEEAKAQAKAIGYPVLLKAKAGGGGKGMRMVAKEADIEEAFRLAQSEAEKSFKDGTLYVEKYLSRARHVEVQVFADTHGNVITIGDRDCSIQRRHQKVIEEAMAPDLSEETRKNMAAASVALAKSVSYRGAGTLEFLVDEDQKFYFLEMNTRLQVEHPVTEWVSGLDLVSLQIHVAFGGKLVDQTSLMLRGHSIEVRLYAEDPDNGFFPVPGKLGQVLWPTGPYVRVDTGVETNSEITLFYDPMVAKISVWAPTRKEAVARMIRALLETVIVGTKTNQGFLLSILSHPSFQKGELSTQFIDQHGPFQAPEASSEQLFAAVAAVQTVSMAPTAQAVKSASDVTVWWRSGLPGAMGKR